MKGTSISVLAPSSSECRSWFAARPWGPFQPRVPPQGTAGTGVQWRPQSPSPHSWQSSVQCSFADQLRTEYKHKDLDPQRYQDGSAEGQIRLGSPKCPGGDE